MKVRISFRSEIVIEGETMEQVVDKWQAMSLFSEEAEDSGVEFYDIESVEDADTFEDLMDEFHEYY